MLLPRLLSIAHCEVYVVAPHHFQEAWQNSVDLLVQVKGQDLREGSRAARDAQQGMRSALGPDYEARLRREAGPDPDKKSRRKHQITSLFHAAKMKVQATSLRRVPCRLDRRKGSQRCHDDAMSLPITL